MNFKYLNSYVTIILSYLNSIFSKSKRFHRNIERRNRYSIFFSSYSFVQNQSSMFRTHDANRMPEGTEDINRKNKQAVPVDKCRVRNKYRQRMTSA